MTEIPALRDALVGAAARRVRRRRRTAIAVLGWTAVAAAVAAVLVLGTFAPQDRERPARTPEPAQGLLERAFPVFARAERPGDTPPGSLLPPGYRDMRARLVRDAGGTRVWLVARTRVRVERFGGREELCATVRGGGEPTGACGDLTAIARDGLVARLGRPADPGRVIFILPSGARDLRVTLPGGVLAPDARDNVAFASPRAPIIGAAWTDGAGVRHIARWRDLHARGWTPSGGCPKLDPLPGDADALARRAALLAVDRVYPWIHEASVTGVTPLGPGLCSREVSDRSLAVELHLTPFEATRSASLTQGRLLVGMQHGEMTVWMVQH